MTIHTPSLATLVDTPEASKDRLIDSLQAQLRDARRDAQDAKHMLLITEAKLDESRRALDRFMGYRS